MRTILLVLKILIFIYSTHGEHGDYDCISPLRSWGKCIKISECEALLSLIKGSTEDREYLKKWHCGFEGEIPKVCCLELLDLITNNVALDTTTAAVTTTTKKSFPDTCITLEGREGTCVNIQKCPALFPKYLSLKKQDWAYVRKSRCLAPDNNHVCCEVQIKKRSNMCQDSGLPDPNSDCCGLDSGGANKIIQGEVAQIDQYPWLAIVNYNYVGKEYMCGGSLISDRFVLTAAHCLVTRTYNDRGAISVVLGEYDITNDGKDCVEVDGGGTDCNSGTATFGISEKFVHPEYIPKDQETIHRRNDIALLKLNDTVTFNDFIKPICLPIFDVTQSLPKNKQFQIAGWGAVDEFRSKSNVKLYLDVPYVSLKSCREHFNRNYIKTPLVWDKQICAGGVDQKDSCKGDSGGPLMNINNKKYELIGIISFGALQCGTEGIPSIHTKVYDYLPWIKSIVNS